MSSSNKSIALKKAEMKEMEKSADDEEIISGIKDDGYLKKLQAVLADDGDSKSKQEVYIDYY